LHIGGGRSVEMVVGKIRGSGDEIPPPELGGGLRAMPPKAEAT